MSVFQLKVHDAHTFIDKSMNDGTWVVRHQFVPLFTIAHVASLIYFSSLFDLRLHRWFCCFCFIKSSSFPCVFFFVCKFLFLIFDSLTRWCVFFSSLVNNLTNVCVWLFFFSLTRHFVYIFAQYFGFLFGGSSIIQPIDLSFNSISLLSPPNILSFNWFSLVIFSLRVFFFVCFIL